MENLKFILWISLFIVFYTYVGYGILLFILIKLKNYFNKKQKNNTSQNYQPKVTLLIPAYNEKDYVDQKMKNSLELNYPSDKLEIVWVTDGSNDGTNILLDNYKNATVFHKHQRKGKINAMNRVMPFIKTPIVVFSDANTLLSKNSITHIISCFSNKKVGCVSGEKRIYNKAKDSASGSGEGIYWKYESTLKKWDAELYSVVGAAGELFAIRTSLYESVEQDTILDDFVISLRIAQKGYTIQYNPDAFAIESASKNIDEELKRKIRISAGGIQSILRLKPLLNIFKYGILSFQYISHRVLRWTITPLCLILLFLVAILITASEGFFNLNIYSFLFWMQLLFYGFVVIGWKLQSKNLRYKFLFIPYYFFIMNLSVLLGFFRFIRKKQSVNWERAKRADIINNKELTTSA